MTLASAHVNRADALRKLGRPQEAAESEQRWESQKQASVLRDASSSSEAPKRTIASADTERTARLRQANDRMSEGTRLLQVEDYEEALSCFDEVIGLDPGRATEMRAYDLKAEALWKLGRVEQAQASEQILETLRQPAMRGDEAGGEIRGELLEEKHHGRDMLIGGLLLVGGGIATLVTYAAAAPGETYFVFWGVMLVGAIQLLRGFFGSMSD